MRNATGRRGYACLGVVLVALVPSVATADTSDQDKALALQLFDAGRSLLAAGKVDDACRKLEESRRLDPLPGTLLNLAVCHEQQGRTATAVAELREARALAERDHRDDRVALVDQHLKALEGKVSSLVIVVPPEADRPDLSVTSDETPVGRVAWGTRIPVDPGAHALAASAANKKTWKVTVTVAAGGDVQTATVAPLEDAAPAAVPAPPVAPLPPPVAPVQSAPPPPVPDQKAESHGMSARREIALVAAGLGVVGVGVGSYFGVTAISKHHDPEAACSVEPCTQATALNNDAKFAADASTLTFGLGAAALAAGAVLWLTAPGAPEKKGGLRMIPSVTLGRAGVDVVGGF